MSEQHDLSPTSPEWLANWRILLLTNPTLLSSTRPLTRGTILKTLKTVYSTVKDMPVYRKPLADFVWILCQQQASDFNREEEEDTKVLWYILSDEIVLRATEDDAVDESVTVDSYINLLTDISAEESGNDDGDSASVVTNDTHTPSIASSTVPSTVVSSRFQSENQGVSGESAMPSVMSLWSSLATGTTSRSQSLHPPRLSDGPGTPASFTPTDPPPLPRSATAVVALVSVFTQLAFTPHSPSVKSLSLAIRIYQTLVNLLVRIKDARTRLTILQFLVRIRADRNHQLYYVEKGYDPDDHIFVLASLINRIGDSLPLRSMTCDPRNDDALTDSAEPRKARAQTPARDGRRFSRGRGVRPSRSEASRSRSRGTHPFLSAQPNRNQEALWQIPESLPFIGATVDTPSEELVSYSSETHAHRLVLPVSEYLAAIVGILENEVNWDILSYVLCHLPVQLANKHLFCGPKSRLGIVQILTTLCNGILNGELASQVVWWPSGLRARDAHGLAYHTLSVLVSYQRCFDLNRKHALVETFQTGLNGQPSTVKCCLHALSLSAFELPSSITKYLSFILEKLSQIMSNPDMAVHILSFLSVVGSLRPLHANFRDGEFKRVFGVALQYLQHHNRPGSSPTISWALSQHVRILSYYVLYVWFLAVQLPDRTRHVRFITRQLLLANDGNVEVDDQSEVCFDWLARYTYASADPRPANSLLNDILSNPTPHSSLHEPALSEKAWILGNSVVTVRALAKLGWIEVVTRRPSGFTKFLCRVENVPMVRSGDVDPDLMSNPASLLMERGRPRAQAPDQISSLETPVTVSFYGAIHRFVVKFFVRRISAIYS
jgi:tuberous sclerosis 2